MGMKKYVGRLEDFSEQGSEGILWHLREDGKTDYYESLVRIEKGDFLAVYNPDGTTAFDGLIQPDNQAGRTPYPRNPEYSQPAALGYWIHWTQSGWDPDRWAALFCNYDAKNGKKLRDEHLRAELVKHRDRVNRVVFTKDLKKSNVFRWYLNDEDADNKLGGGVMPNTVNTDIIAAKLDSRTLVFNRYAVYFGFNLEGNRIFIETHDDTRNHNPLIFSFPRQLILRAYRDEDLIYSSSSVS